MTDINGIEFRKAVESQAEIRQIAGVLLSSYNIGTQEEAERAARAELSRGISYVVAVKGGNIIGIASYLPHGLPRHGLAELDRIAVLPDFRKSGIGSRLFSSLVAFLKKDYEKDGSSLRKLYVLTHMDNLAAQKFYGRMGMKQEAVLRSHYYSQKDECVLSIFYDA